MTKLKELVMSFILMGSTLFVPILAVAPVGAQCLDGSSGGGIAECLNQGTCETDPDSCATEPNAEDKVNGIIRLVINLFSLIVGVISVIMIIIGGLKYITSGGDSSNVSGAKNTILYAIIGLVVVALAQVIVRFVLQKATGVEG